MLSFRPFLIVATFIVSPGCKPRLGGSSVLADETVCEQIADPPSLDAIKAYALCAKPASPAALVKKLPASLQRRFALVYETGSLQPASAKYPRVLLFGPSSEFVLGISGLDDPAASASAKDPTAKPFTPSHPPNESIEVIAFDRATLAFLPATIAFESGEPEFFDGSDAEHPRPTDCVGCHTNRFRPNWFAYPLWTGFYGSYDDVILVGSPEDQGFRSFVEHAAHLEPYGELIGINATFAPHPEATRRFVDRKNPDSVYYPVSTVETTTLRAFGRTEAYVDEFPRPLSVFNAELANLNHMGFLASLFDLSYDPNRLHAAYSELGVEPCRDQAMQKLLGASWREDREKLQETARQAYVAKGTDRFVQQAKAMVAPDSPLRTMSGPELIEQIRKNKTGVFDDGQFLVLLPAASKYSNLSPPPVMLTSLRQIFRGDQKIEALLDSWRLSPTEGDEAFSDGGSGINDLPVAAAIDAWERTRAKALERPRETCIP